MLDYKNLFAKSPEVFGFTYELHPTFHRTSCCILFSKAKLIQLTTVPILNNRFLLTWHIGWSERNSSPQNQFSQFLMKYNKVLCRRLLMVVSLIWVFIMQAISKRISSVMCKDCWVMLTPFSSQTLCTRLRHVVLKRSTLLLLHVM